MDTIFKEGGDWLIQINFFSNWKQCFNMGLVGKLDIGGCVKYAIFNTLMGC